MEIVNDAINNLEKAGLLEFKLMFFDETIELGAVPREPTRIDRKDVEAGTVPSLTTIVIGGNRGLFRVGHYSCENEWRADDGYEYFPQSIEREGEVLGAFPGGRVISIGSYPQGELTHNKTDGLYATVYFIRDEEMNKKVRESNGRAVGASVDGDVKMVNGSNPTSVFTNPDGFVNEPLVVISELMQDILGGLNYNTNYGFLHYADKKLSVCTPSFNLYVPDSEREGLEERTRQAYGFEVSGKGKAWLITRLEGDADNVTGQLESMKTAYCDLERVGQVLQNGNELREKVLSHTKAREAYWQGVANYRLAINKGLKQVSQEGQELLSGILDRSGYSDVRHVR
ncbi:MAG: hypothetical protein KKG59_06525 [Nanoarchaeota archaeon]|nr:hypothetical protein [Nanoarchaeota archaeon]